MFSFAQQNSCEFIVDAPPGSSFTAAIYFASPEPPRATAAHASTEARAASGSAAASATASATASASATAHATAHATTAAARARRTVHSH